MIRFIASVITTRKLKKKRKKISGGILFFVQLEVKEGGKKKTI